MRVTRAEVILTKVPVIRAHKMAIGTTTNQEAVFLKLFTDNGLVGWGEAPHMVGYSGAGETQSSVALQLKERLVPAVLGKSPLAIEAGVRELNRALPWNPRAKSAVNMALYDLAGKFFDTPVYNLTGGKCRDGIPLSWSLPIVDVEAGTTEAVQMVERGFTILKVKTGRPDPWDDVAMFREIRRAVGDGIRLRADANQGWDVRSAIRAIRAMEEYRPEFVEQPVKGDDIDGMAEVRRATSVHIMADESANSPLDVLNLARKRAADVISIYINNSGGISEAKKMAIVAEPVLLGCYIGGALEGPIAARACLHFGVSTPNVTWGCEMGGQFLLQEDLSVEPLAFQDGELIVPDGPGLGGALDEERARRYEIGRFTIEP